jgi:glycosyltransferase involved in cell wall biosynthesis
VLGKQRSESRDEVVMRLIEADARADYALVGMPLSNGYRQRFEQATVSIPTYLWLSELRRMSAAQMLWTLRSLKAGRLFIPLEDESAHSFVPVAFSLAAMAAAKEVILVDSSLKMRAIPRIRLIGALASIFSASGRSLLSLQRGRRELEALMKAPRINVCPPGRGEVLYLRTNMSYGIKAGGSVGHIAGVVNALVKQGHPVEYVSVEPPTMLAPSVRYRPIVPLAEYGIPYEANLYRFHEHCVSAVRAAASERRYSFVYQRMSVANYTGAVVSRDSHLPLVVEYNGSERWLAANWSVKLRFDETAERTELVSLKHAHLVVTVSDVLKDDLLSRGVESSRIVVYPNCIDPQVFDPDRFPADATRELRQRLGIPADAIVAAFVGTFGQWHGADVLATAIRRMASDRSDWLRKTKLHFLFVGDGLLMPKVKEILGGERLSELFTLTGLVRQSEAPAYIASADLLLSPHVPNADGSRFFGSPTKLFEYMAMGKPIVASDLEQIGEVLSPSAHIIEGRRPESVPPDALAVLCAPGSVDDLVEGIALLVENPELRRRLGERARTVALSQYTWDKHVAEILERVARI